MRLKIVTLFLIIFTVLTIWIQFPYVKDFTNSKISKITENKILGGDKLQAMPYFETTKILDGNKNTNLPGPLLKKNTTQEDEEEKLIKKEKIITQPEFNANSIIQETNIFRTQNNLQKLTTNQTLNKMAKEKMEDMFNRGYFEHISPLGVSIEDIALENKYDYLVIGENLALGSFKTAKEVVDAWAKSEPHRKNMLDIRYSEIGVALQKALFNGHPTIIIVQHFGKSISSCPNVSKKIKEKIDYVQNELKLMKNKIEELKKEIEKGYKEELVVKHNKLVSDYNNKLIELKNLVEDYNKQVEEFNSCIEKISN